MINPIVIWVPGTSNHSINKSFADALPIDIEPVLVDYKASWNLTESVPDGVKRLKRMLALAQKKRKHGQRILLAGESQGAWVISETLTDPKYRSIVDGAVLLGNPGVAPIHFSGPDRVTFDRFVEINHKYDYATFRWLDSPLIPEAVSNFMAGDMENMPLFLSMLLKHPLQAAISGFMLLKHIPALRGIIPNPHDYDEDMRAAVEWLLYTV